MSLLTRAIQSLQWSNSYIINTIPGSIISEQKFNVRYVDVAKLIVKRGRSTGNSTNHIKWKREETLKN